MIEKNPRTLYSPRVRCTTLHVNTFIGHVETVKCVVVWFSLDFFFWVRAEVNEASKVQCNYGLLGAPTLILPVFLFFSNFHYSGISQCRQNCKCSTCLSVCRWNVETMNHFVMSVNLLMIPKKSLYNFLFFPMHFNKLCSVICAFPILPLRKITTLFSSCLCFFCVDKRILCWKTR